MIAEFIQKVIVHERAEKNKRFTRQKVEIYLNFIEDFTPPAESLTDGEPADSEQSERERKREYHREYQKRRKENGGRPLTPTDTRTPEQIAADEAAKREKWKEYQRDYQREWQRKKAREKREAKAAQSDMAATA